MRSSDASAFASTVAGRSASSSTRVPSRTSGTIRLSAAKRHERLVHAVTVPANRRTSRCRGRDGRSATTTCNPRRPRPARGATIVSKRNGRSARDRVVVLRKREPDLHPRRLSARDNLPSSLRVLECVANVSEGRDRRRSRRDRHGRCGAALLDVHRDHRPQPERVHDRRRPAHDTDRDAPDRGRDGVGTRSLDTTTASTRVSARSTSCRSSRSTAPPSGRDGRGSTQRSRCGGRASTTCRASSTTTPTREVATFRRLRREAFVDREPDFGPAKPHLRLGATAVGARAPRRAELRARRRHDRRCAAAIAQSVRERDGGLRGVRALGFWLASRDRPQVSMNLVDLEATGVDAGVRPGSSSWPQPADAGSRRSSWSGCSRRPSSPAAARGFASAAGVDERRTIEARLARSRWSRSRRSPFRDAGRE